MTAGFVLGFAGLALTALGVSACTSVQRGGASTADVLARHQKTFGANDVDGVLADYAADAVMFTPGGPVKGTDALRKTFQTLFAEWSKPGLKFEMKNQTVEGPYAYMHWNAETADNVYEAGTDAFVVQSGKIVAHFFSAKITPKR